MRQQNTWFFDTYRNVTYSSGEQETFPNAGLTVYVEGSQAHIEVDEGSALAFTWHELSQLTDILIEAMNALSNGAAAQRPAAVRSPGPPVCPF